GIGLEVTRDALREPLDAHLTVIGAQEQVAEVPADERIAVGSWRPAAAGGGEPGTRTVLAGQLAGHALERGARLALDCSADALVTAPVEKLALPAAGFPYPGQTEWLGELAGGADVAMMLTTGALRVVLVTTHLALRDVPAVLTPERIVRCGRVTRQALTERFGI